MRKTRSLVYFLTSEPSIILISAAQTFSTENKGIFSLTRGTFTLRILDTSILLLKMDMQLKRKPSIALF